MRPLTPMQKFQRIADMRTLQQMWHHINNPTPYLKVWVDYGLIRSAKKRIFTDLN